MKHIFIFITFNIVILFAEIFFFFVLQVFLLLYWKCKLLLLAFGIKYNFIFSLRKLFWGVEIMECNKLLNLGFFMVWLFGFDPEILKLIYFWNFSGFMWNYWMQNVVIWTLRIIFNLKALKLDNFWC